MPEETQFDLKSLKPGDKLAWEGDDGEQEFVCATQETGGPCGTLYTKDDSSLVLAQLVGMVPFVHHATSFMPSFEPGVLKNEYGRLAILVIDQNGDHQFVMKCCSEFNHVAGSPEA